MASTTNFAIETPSVGGFRNTWGGTLNTGLSKIDELLALAMPIGTIQMYPKTTAPVATTNGGTWLVCDGSSKVRTDYPELHTLITNTYGTYPSGTTFLLPDLRSRVPVGYNASGIDTGTVNVRSARAISTTTGGTEEHILANTEIPKHTHPITDAGHEHPIDPDITHDHTGANSGSNGLGTSNAPLTINDPKHAHTFKIVNGWSSETGVPYSIQSGPGHSHRDFTSDLVSTNITIDDHNHSFTTTAENTNITTTLTNTSGRLSATELQADGNGSHNNMQPYLVVNYIILAKHPTF